MPLEVTALAPLSVAALLWRDAGGVLQLSAVAKATFEIRPDQPARLVDPYPLFGDLYFEGNDGRSLRVASDYAPAKARADVLFTGSAYAPVGERVTHRPVRLAVASEGRILFDKRLLAIGTRARDRAGMPAPPEPFSVLPLRWELAYGGASSRTNPIGVGEDPGDPRLPSLVDPADPKRAASFGPVSPSWWARRQALGGADPAIFVQPVPTLRAGIDLAYFNAAPEDQQITLRGDESVLMSGVHPALTELTFRLPGQRAHARVEFNGARRDIALVLDTLWIEGDTLRCTLTWRGTLALDGAEASKLDSARVVMTLAQGDSAPTWERGAAAGVEPPVMIGAAAAAGEGVNVFPRASTDADSSIARASKDERRRIPRRVTPTLPIVNETGWVAWTIPWQIKPPDYSTAVVVKATYTIGADGTLTLAPEQDPPSGDVAYEPDETTPHGTSLRYASDFAVFKPAADVMLVGHAYPRDEASGLTNVELRVGSLRRHLAVFGDRKWGTFGFDERPARFEKMPLRWERALGGPLSEVNPVGRGFKTGVVVPNVERPEALIRTRDDRPAPACFGPIARTWKVRRDKSGKFDAAWLRERWPYLPADFDWSHFNAAPAEQQVPYLRGDERYSIVGVRPGGGAIGGQLPGVKPRVFAQRIEEAGGNFFEVPLHLDTVWFDTDGDKLVLVWRGLYTTPDDDSPDIAALYVELERGAPQASVDDVRERFLARIASSELLPVAAMSFPEETAEPAPRRSLPSAPAPVSRQEVLTAIASGVSIARRDLTGVDLEGANLSGADLRGVVLARANLTDAVLDRAKLAGAVLAGARAERASFIEADLTGADLTEAKLAQANFEKAILVRAVLDRADATGARFVGAQADRASFVGAALNEATLEGARFAAADLSRATLTGATLSGATLDDVRLYEARAEGAIFDGASMVRARAERAQLRGVSFAKIVAKQSVWQSADLTGAIFAEAKLESSLFLRATLDDANFAKATATEASFQRASLKRAKCLRANLMQAVFERADLTDADLRGANLYQADTWRAKTVHTDLAGANLAGTKLAPRR